MTPQTPATGGALTDAQIAQQTKIEEQGSRLRFSMKLPSGREVEGGFSAGSRSAAIIKWCEAVNAAIASDQEEERLRQKRAAQEAAQAIALPPGALPPVKPAVGMHVSANPLDFVKSQIESAEKAEAYWQVQKDEAERQWTRAKTDLTMWRKMGADLGV